MKTRKVGKWVIESEIPIPPVDSSKAGRPREIAQDIESLKAGEGYRFTGESAYQKAQSLYQTARRAGVPMKIRSTRNRSGEKLVRVTRTV